MTPFVAAAALAAVFSAAACGPSSDGTPATYAIVFSLGATPESTDLGKLHFTVEYDTGDFSGEGASVVCSLVADADGETADFTDDDQGKLTIEIDATANALEEGNEIVECDFVAATQPTANSFTVSIDLAKDDSGDTVSAADVDVVVTSTDLK